MELAKLLLLRTAFSFSGCPAGTVAYCQGTAFATPRFVSGYRLGDTLGRYHSSFNSYFKNSFKRVPAKVPAQSNAPF
jgi:hypothetical protein